MTRSSISAVLAADFHELLSDLNIHQFDLPASSATLRRDLKLAVRSAHGFTLTVQGHLQLPVSLHVVEQPLHLADVATALRLPLTSLAPDESLTTITLYADRPGALVDLAADLTHALRLPLEAAVLDPPLPDEVISSGLVGLVEFNLVSQAVGVLIAQGLSPVEARRVLHRDPDGASVVHAARELLTKARTPAGARPADDVSGQSTGQSTGQRTDGTDP